MPPGTSGGGRHALHTVTVYEADVATISQGVVESNHIGFTGTGFVNYDNLVGSSVEFTVTVSGAQTTSLNLRFANGTTTNRPMDIAVNGKRHPDHRRPGVPRHRRPDDLADGSLPVALVDGVNTVKASAVAANGGPNLDSLSVSDRAGTDWSVAMVESTMARFSPNQIGGWSYPVGLYLVYQRTREPRYLAYIKAWVDRFVSSSRDISQRFNNLDSMLFGRLLNILHRKTSQDRYRIAAQRSGTA